MPDASVGVGTAVLGEEQEGFVLSGATKKDHVTGHNRKFQKRVSCRDLKKTSQALYERMQRGGGQKGSRTLRLLELEGEGHEWHRRTYQISLTQR